MNLIVWVCVTGSLNGDVREFETCKSELLALAVATDVCEEWKEVALADRGSDPMPSHNPARPFLDLARGNEHPVGHLLRALDWIDSQSLM